MLHKLLQAEVLGQNSRHNRQELHVFDLVLLCKKIIDLTQDLNN